MVKIGNASISEYGTINGKVGDQTGREVYIRDWYSYPWDCIIRFADKKFAFKVAECMVKACINNLFGYGQSDRYGLWDSLVGYKFDPETINKPTNCDCSSLTGVCIQYAICALKPKMGVVSSLKWVTTYTLLETLRLSLPNIKYSVYYDKKYTSVKDNLEIGDILLNVNNHVAVVTQTDKSDTHPEAGIIEASVSAYEYNRSKTGTYTANIKNVPDNFLMVRDKPTTNSNIMTTISYGEKVHNFGYYTSNKEGEWLYCMVYKGAKIYVGFISANFLEKV